ncbi:flagellar FliJ family protein [Atlantibacter hermannii]|uniref:flagellar FliJ family protein n=1 Tax=Atlantibacter hermannii TaxID=565 RepID=UPI0028A017EA|nr:flagellar FliJ family protein [Atlantibacter hermannii]MDU1952500.1 flagellar FliJ family protein [Atlantibacter hermannii]
MNPLIDTLAHLKRIRQKAVQDQTVELAQQKQQCARVDNNIKALGMLMQKTGIHARDASAAALKNVAGYKGSLQRVMKWQEEELALATIKRNRIQSSLVTAACQEKVVALTLDESVAARQAELAVKQQKASDDVAIQCWMRRLER